MFLISISWSGCYICHKANEELGVHDHKSIVLDECIGMWFILVFLQPNSMLEVIFSFILFRVFDIWKPWPISWFDRTVKGGIGIVLDDIISSVIVVVCILFFNMFHCL